jgi:hypothetical protein
MSWASLSAALYNLAVADTGVGGLSEASGAAQVDAIYTDIGPEDADLSDKGFLIISAVSAVHNDVFDPTKQTREYGWQADVYTPRVRATTKTRHESVVERTIDLFRRVAPTVVGWTVSQTFLESHQDMQIDGDAYRTTLDFTTTMSK